VADATVEFNLIEGGFKGPVMPVNPDQQSVSGVLAYKDIASLPVVPDLAILTTPVEEAPELIGVGRARHQGRAAAQPGNVAGSSRRQGGAAQPGNAPANIRMKARVAETEGFWTPPSRICCASWGRIISVTRCRRPTSTPA
jgi:hypothetical protein